jgi:hypothetical protein
MRNHAGVRDAGMGRCGGVEGQHSWGWGGGEGFVQNQNLGAAQRGMDPAGPSAEGGRG